MRPVEHKTGTPDARQIVLLIYFAMYGAAFLYLLVLQVAAPPANPHLSPVIKQMLWGLAAGNAALVIFFRQRKILPILEQPVAGAAELSRLRVHYIVSFALSEAVLLFGFALRMLGSTVMEAGVPFLAGLVLFAINYPRWPAGAAT